MIIMDDLHYKSSETPLYKKIKEILDRKAEIYGLQFNENSIEKIFFSNNSDLIEIMETNIPILKTEISKSIHQSRIYFGNEGCSIVYSWKDYVKNDKIVKASCFGGY